MNNHRGFTLIELLVVIAIIGLLASIVLVSLNSARAKARDAQRLGSMDSMKKAFELYYASNNTYPNPGTAQCGGGITEIWSDWSAACWQSFIPTTILSKTPTDPLNNDNGADCSTTANCHVYHYCWLNSGMNYILAVNLENAPTFTYGSPAGCATAGPNQYWVKS